MKCLIVFLCALAFASAATIGKKNENQMVRHARVSENMNEYLDSILESVVPWLSENGMNPMALPDLVESFSCKPLLITYHGEFSLRNGKIFNINEVLRRGDAFMTPNDTQVRIEATIGVTSLELNYNYLAQLMGIGPYGSIEGYIGNIVIYGDIVIDMGETLKISLNDLKIQSVGTVDLKLTGNVVFDWIANGLLKVIIPLVKDQLTGVVSEKVKDAVQNMIEDINTRKPEVAQRLLMATR